MKFLLCFVLLMTSVTLQAATLTQDAGWPTFLFGRTGSIWDTTFTFTTTDTTRLTVTDAFLSGDRFDVLSSGSSLGLTSATSDSGTQIWNDYDTAAADARWSTGIYTLLASTYSITGTAIISPFRAGRGAIRLDAVPVPAAVWLMGSALLGLMGLSRKNKA